MGVGVVFLVGFCLRFGVFGCCFFFTDAAVKTETLNNHQERKLCIHRDRPLHTSFYFCDPNAFIYLKYFPLTVVFLTHCLHTKHPKANTQI